MAQLEPQARLAPLDRAALELLGLRALLELPGARVVLGLLGQQGLMGLLGQPDRLARPDRLGRPGLGLLEPRALQAQREPQAALGLLALE